MPRGDAKAGDRRSDRGRRRGTVRRRAEPELGPMPATLAALPLPSLPTGGGWRRTGDPSAASLPWTRGGPQKGKDRSDQAWAAPAAPVRPITNQRPKPIRGPRRSKAARAGVRLANRPPPGGWLARGPRARVRRWRLLTRVLGGPSDARRTAVALREVRVRRKGNYCVDVRIASHRNPSGGGRLGGDGKPPANHTFCKSTLYRFWIPTSTGLIWVSFYPSPKDGIVDHGLVHCFPPGAFLHVALVS